MYNEEGWRVNEKEESIMTRFSYPFDLLEIAVIHSNVKE